MQPVQMTESMNTPADIAIRLDLRSGVAVGETHHGAYLQLIAHIGGGPLHIAGRDADGGSAAGEALVTDRLDLVPGGGGGQKCVIHVAKQFAVIHIL